MALSPPTDLDFALSKARISSRAIATPMLSEISEQAPAGSVQPRSDRRAPTNKREAVEQRLLCERPRHLRFLLAKLRSREDAEDALQDFTIKALRGADRVREDRIGAWLNVSLRNALFDRYRRDSSRRRLNQAAAVEPVSCAEPDLIKDVASDCIAMSVAELKPSYAIVLRRVDLEEASLGELACELGLTTNNTAVRLHRARAILRRVMHDRCTACPAPCLLAARFIARSAA